MASGVRMEQAQGQGYPYQNRVMLASVKEGLYHPRVPTFRRMDMDTAAHKLPDEHCRTTTRIHPREFSNATITYFTPSMKHYSGANITDTGRSLREVLKDDVSGLKIDWSKAKQLTSSSTLEKEGELRFTWYAVRYLKPNITGAWRNTLKQEPMLDRYGQRPVPANIFGLKIDWSKAKQLTSSSTLEKKGELRFTGYAVRYLKPNITGAWRNTLKQEPMLDQYGQRPVPANIFSRYRDTFPRALTTESFR